MSIGLRAGSRGPRPTLAGLTVEMSETSICAQPSGCFLSAHTHPNCGVPAEESRVISGVARSPQGCPLQQAASVSTEILHMRGD